MNFARIFIFLLLAMALVAVSGQQGCEEIPVKECLSNNNCVPAQCCHPTSCIAVDKAPSCKGIACTEECRNGTMDCGEGHCGCVDNKCQAIMTGKI